MNYLVEPMSFYNQSNFIFKEMCFEQNSRYRGVCQNCKASEKDYFKVDGRRDTLEGCVNLCQSRVGCKFYSWRSFNKQCVLYQRVYEKVPVEDAFSGRIDCSQQGTKINSQCLLKKVNVKWV